MQAGPSLVQDLHLEDGALFRDPEREDVGKPLGMSKTGSSVPWRYDD